MPSRRDMLIASSLAVAATGSAPRPAGAVSGDSEHYEGLARRIVAAVDRLPGKKGLEIFAPAAAGAPEFTATIEPQTALFIASAFKGFVLAEYLRQVEAGEAALDERLDLDESVWSPGAPVFNPPELAGKVKASTALEAMIAHSDNTATDMALRRAGADRVRDFIASIGLHDTRIPTSTRRFFGFISGLPTWETTTWDELVAILENDPYPTNPIINDTITMAASPHDLVSFYSRALPGEFFEQPETLLAFRSILAQSDANPRGFPLGVNAFTKGGSIDFGADHALSLAGGMFVPDRWVYFSLIINWTDAEGGVTADVLPEFAATSMQVFTWIRDELGNCEHSRT